MKKENTLKLVQAALYAALVFVATSIIKIPTPGTSGYIHPGDAFVILSGAFLGPVYGSLAAAIGSALSDLVGGYMLYVPATFIIKGLSALAVGLIFKAFKEKFKAPTLLTLICGVVSGAIVVVGYLVFELFIYGTAALLSVVPNIIQVVGGLIISTILYPILNKIMSRF